MAVMFLRLVANRILQDKGAPFFPQVWPAAQDNALEIGCESQFHHRTSMNVSAVLGTSKRCRVWRETNSVEAPSLKRPIGESRLQSRFTIVKHASGVMRSDKNNLYRSA